MGINFPSSPAIGTLHPDPAQAGIPQYRWDGTAWVAAGDNKFTLTVGDTPPLSPVQGQLWWESDSGNLAVYYDDGSGAQWVQAVAVPMTDTAPADGKFYARQGNVWVEVPRYQRFSLAGGKSFDVQVPAGATMARLTGSIYLSSVTGSFPSIRISVAPGVFLSGASDYITYGYYHGTNTAPTTVIPQHGVQGSAMPVTAGHANVSHPVLFEGVMTLKRPTGASFTADFRGCAANSVEIWHSFYESGIAAAAGSVLNVLAFRFFSGAGDNWADGSYLNVEWM